MRKRTPFLLAAAVALAGAAAIPAAAAFADESAGAECGVDQVTMYIDRQAPQCFGDGVPFTGAVADVVAVRGGRGTTYAKLSDDTIVSVPEHERVDLGGKKTILAIFIG